MNDTYHNDYYNYYYNPRKLLHSSFVDYILDGFVSFAIYHNPNSFFIRFSCLLVLLLLMPMIVVWWILDLIGNVLDYISYHYSVTFILWGLSKEAKVKDLMAKYKAGQA